MSRVALDLGFIQIYWYSIMILLGLLVALIVIYKEVKKQNINTDFFTNLTFYSIIIGIISARIYYVIFNWAYYSNNILEIFEIWNGGLAIHGGIIGGGVFALIYCYKYKVDFYRVFDICVVGLIAAQAIGRWGNFFNQEAYGTITTSAELLSLGIPEFIVNGMNIGGSYYHPTFFYECIWNIIGFIILILVRWLVKKLKTGQLTGIYLIWYSIGRIIIESMRMDSLMLGNLKMAQLISVIFIILGIVIIVFRTKDNRSTSLYKRGEQNEIRF